MDTLSRDNSGNLNFKVTSSKVPDFLQKFQLVIIGACRIFKSNQQSYLIFAKFYFVEIRAVQVFK